MFSQRGQLRFISDHLKQKGPSFPHPIDVSIDAVGHVTVAYRGDDGKEKLITERLELPDEVANGLVLPPGCSPEHDTSTQALLSRQATDLI